MGTTDFVKTLFKSPCKKIAATQRTTAIRCYYIIESAVLAYVFCVPATRWNLLFFLKN